MYIGNFFSNPGGPGVLDETSVTCIGRIQMHHTKNCLVYGRKTILYDNMCKIVFERFWRACDSEEYAYCSLEGFGVATNLF